MSRKTGYRFSGMRRPIGQAALLSWLRKLLPARMFEPSLRNAFALDPSSKGTVMQPRTRW